MEYSFKRDFYEMLIKEINKKFVIFLCGPVKSGKTICLKQVQHDFPNAFYYSSKDIDENLLNKIKDDIRNYKEHIFLLDDIADVPNAEFLIYDLACEFTYTNNMVTKVVFAGNQYPALYLWGCRSFAGQQGNVYADFLTYHEYLRWKGSTDISYDTYQEFIREVSIDYVCIREALAMDFRIIDHKNSTFDVLSNYFSHYHDYYTCKIITNGYNSVNGNIEIVDCFKFIYNNYYTYKRENNFYEI